MGLIGIDSLAANLTNPQRVYLWEVIIPNPVGGGDSEVFRLRCQSTSIPGRSVGSIHIPFKGTAGIKVPGKLTYSHAWSVTLIEGEDKKVFDFLYNWSQKQVHDRSGVSDGDILIKTDVYLTLISTKGDPTLKVKLIGCYIESIEDVSLDYAAEDRMMIPATFSYDRWEKM